MGESSITGPDRIRDTFENVSLIRQCLLTSQSRQKSYNDVRRRPLEFKVGDHVFLKVMPKRGVVRFWQEREAIAEVHWALRDTREGRHCSVPVGFTTQLSGFHEVFHVSMLRRYTPDPAHVVD